MEAKTTQYNDAEWCVFVDVNDDHVHQQPHPNIDLIIIIIIIK